MADLPLDNGYVDPMVGMQIGPRVETDDDDGMNAFGKPVPLYRKSAGLEHLRQMIPGLSTAQATKVIDQMAEKIARDQPYEAMQVPQQVRLDLTGTYRLLAVLCATPKPRVRVTAGVRHVA